MYISLIKGGNMIYMNDITLYLVNQFLLTKQHLKGDCRTGDIVQTVRDICALHATGIATPYLSLFARTKNFKREQLDEELYIKKRLGKIRCMRRTIHVLPKEVIPLAYAATRRLLQEGSTAFLEFRGVSTNEYETISKRILEILKGQEMTTSEIKGIIGTELNISAIVEQMCDQGLLIRGRPRKGWKGKVQNYSLFRDYFPDLDLNKTEVEARSLLACHYLRSFGPATENDIAWWVGIGKNQARAALNSIQDQIEQIAIPDLDGSFIMLKSDEKRLKVMKTPKTQTVNLLPSLDPYLMGYKDRERYLSPEHREYVFDRGGNATTTILLDGKIVGGWGIEEAEESLVKLHLFEKVEQSVLNEIRLQARKTGEFIAERTVRTKECDSMAPLTRRTTGGFMAPLKGC
jgi:hypothetical protein